MEKWMIWKFTLSEITQTEKFLTRMGRKDCVTSGKRVKKAAIGQLVQRISKLWNKSNSVLTYVK